MTRRVFISARTKVVVLGMALLSMGCLDPHYSDTAIEQISLVTLAILGGLSALLSP
jgi:hypothetical protein